MKTIRVVQRSIIRNRDRGYDEKVLEITLDDGKIVYSNYARVIGECEFIYTTDGGNFSVRAQTKDKMIIDDGVILPPDSE